VLKPFLVAYSSGHVLMANVQILLATHNSEAYLQPLLESLLDQDMAEFELLVRDDASTDATLDILEAHRGAFGGRLRLLPDRGASGGHIANFSRLMEAADADYVLFADHDDVWLPSKVRRTVEGLAALEADAGRATPAFWFCDATIVDAELTTLTDSFWRQRRLAPDVAADLRRSVLCAIAIGCTSGLNRALLECARPLPVESIVGHDWYLTLVAAAIGRVGWADQKLMLYRQYGGNVSAVSQRTRPRDLLAANNKRARVRRGMELRRRQAGAVLERFGAEMSGADRRTLERFVATGGQSGLARRWALLSGRFLYPDIPRNVGMLLHC